MASSGCPWLAQSATSSSPVPELLHEPEVLPGATGCPRLLVWSQIDESCRALVSSYSFFRAFPQVFTLPVLDVFLSFQLQRLLIAFDANRKKRVDEFLLLLLFCLTCFLFSLINNIWIWFLYSQISLIGYFTCFLLRRQMKLAVF